MNKRSDGTRALLFVSFKKKKKKRLWLSWPFLESGRVTILFLRGSAFSFGFDGVLAPGGKAPTSAS